MWLDVGKSRPKFSNLTKKMPFFEKAQNIAKYFGYIWMKICSQTLSKIDQSSHTEGVYCKSLLRNMRKMGSGKNPSNKEAKK